MIKLNNGYYIESNGNQYTLIVEKQSIKKETNESYTSQVTLGYYSDLSQALKGYCNKVILNKTSDADMELADVLKEMAKLKDELAGVIKAYE